MKKIFWLLPLAIVFLSACGSAPSNNSTQANAPASGQKFSEQPYFARSYLISSETLSPEAKTAIAGFELSRLPQADGTVQITLKATESGYHDQAYTLKPGEQLYFIEKYLGDDSGNKETSIGDDSAVIVDKDGNVVQAPTGF